MEALVEGFGRKIPSGLGIEEKIEWLVNFSEIGDYRRWQTVVKNVTELNSIAFNIRDKLICLKELLAILEQTEISDTDKLERMLYLIDK